MIGHELHTRHFRSFDSTWTNHNPVIYYRLFSAYWCCLDLNFGKIHGSQISESYGDVEFTLTYGIAHSFIDQIKLQNLPTHQFIFYIVIWTSTCILHTVCNILSKSAIFKVRHGCIVSGNGCCKIFPVVTLYLASLSILSLSFSCSNFWISFSFSND